MFDLLRFVAAFLVAIAAGRFAMRVGLVHANATQKVFETDFLVDVGHAFRVLKTTISNVLWGAPSKEKRIE